MPCGVKVIQKISKWTATAILRFNIPPSVPLNARPTITGAPEIKKYQVRNNYALSTQQVRNIGYSCIIIFFVHKVRNKYAKWGFQEHQNHFFFFF